MKIRHFADRAGLHEFVRTPPTLTCLTRRLNLQTTVALSQLPHPASDKPEVQREQAKHAIDTLAMLVEKTEGNRTPEETSEMDRMLHELRMAFVGVQQQGAAESG